jgi:hypothetical protein
VIAAPPCYLVQAVAPALDLGAVLNHDDVPRLSWLSMPSRPADVSSLEIEA